MGWYSGSILMSELIKSLKKHIGDPDGRTDIYKDMIIAFEDHDWDTQNECIGEDPAFDKALRSIHSDYFEEDNQP
jgi:hypothetical protein